MNSSPHIPWSRVRSASIGAVAILCGLELALIGASFLLAGRRASTAGLYLLALTAPLEVYRTDVGGVNLSLFRLSVFVAICLLVAESRGKQAARLSAVSHVFTARLGTAYVAVAVLVAASIGLGKANDYLAWRVLAQIAIGIVVLGLIREIVIRSSVHHFVRAVVAGSFLPIVAASWQAVARELGASPALPLLDRLPVPEGLEKSRVVIVNFGGGDSAVRLKGTFTDPNHFGAYLVIVLAFALALAIGAYWRKQGPQAVTWTAAFTAASVSLVGTYSRTGWLAAGAALLVLGATIYPLARARMRSDVGPRRKLVGVALAGTLAAAALAPVAPTVYERLMPGSEINAVTNISHRETLERALDAFTDKPFFGIGVGQLGVVLHQGPRTSGAHSSFVTAAAELGLLGLGALMIAAAITLDGLAKWYRRLYPGAAALIPGAFFAAYLGFLVANATYDLWWDDFHWVVLGGFATAVSRIQARTLLRRAASGYGMLRHLDRRPVAPR